MPADKEKKTFDDVPSESIQRFPRYRPVDYAAVLADLEAKRAELDRVITSLRAIVSSGVIIGVADGAPPLMRDSVSVELHGGEIPVGAFLGKTIPEAAKLCLQITKRKMKTREIVDALLKGGIETTAKTSFPSIVHSILMRAVRSGGGIVKLGGSYWGLAEWYPRGVASAPGRTIAKKRQKPGRKPKEPKQKTEATNTSESETIPQRMWDALNKPGVELSAQEIAVKAGTRSNVATMLLGKWIKSGEAEKTASGKYRIVKTAA